MTDLNRYPADQAWLSDLDAELSQNLTTVDPNDLPVVRRGSFRYGLHAFEGKDLRDALNAVYIDCMSSIPRESSEEMENFMRISSQRMQAELESREGVRIDHSVLAVKGPGAFMVREYEGSELEPMPIRASDVLFGTIGGVACGAFPYTETTEPQELLDPVQVAKLSRVVGGLLYLECIWVCSQTESAPGEVVRSDLTEAFIPLVTTGLPLYMAYPLE